MSNSTPVHPISGSTPPDILILHRGVEQVFADILDPESSIFRQNSEILGDFFPEFTAILDQAKQNNFNQLLPTLIAGLEFILGREAYQQGQLELTLNHYRHSLEFWPAALVQGNLELLLIENRETILPNNSLEKLAAILFHIGLCFTQLAASSAQSDPQENWQEARSYLEHSLEIFDNVNRKDLISKFIGSLGQVLRQLKDWDALQKLAQEAINLHISYGSESQLAEDYGFLAEAALHQSKWVHANQLAELALVIQDQSPFNSPIGGGMTQNNSYLYLLAESQKELEQWQITVNQLEEALRQTDLQEDIQGYLKIVQALYKLYFDQDLYAQASRFREEQLQIEYQYGLRSFIGVRSLQAQPQTDGLNNTIALEITNSDRLKNVQYLVEKIKNPADKLIVLYGKSGVGKSSLLNAGLVPVLLEQRSRDNRIPRPILLRIYTDWLRDPNPTTWNLNPVLNLLTQNDNFNVPTVLIFDQFEEFFVVCQQLEQRIPFYQFLQKSLMLSSVTVLLSMRTDTLPYLLECDRLTNLEAILKTEILSKKIIYELDNFTLSQAKVFIEQQTQRSPLRLEPQLIDQVIRDLTVDLDRVRPIELQLIGAQLQANKIHTLEQYHQLGEQPKQKLLERFLDQVIQNCSPREERTPLLILYALTSKQGQRSLKTALEIAQELDTDPQKLEPFLDVLAEEGVILHIPDIPDDRYQLTHDYLWDLIREQKGERLIAQLELQRDQAQRKIIEEKPNSFVNRAIASVFRWIKAE